MPKILIRFTSIHSIVYFSNEFKAYLVFGYCSLYKLFILNARKRSSPLTTGQRLPSRHTKEDEHSIHGLPPGWGGGGGAGPTQTFFGSEECVT